jgi:hypothetical protein
MAALSVHACRAIGFEEILLEDIRSRGEICDLQTDKYLPLPKWRRKSTRPSLLDLLALLRDQIFATAVEAPVLHFDDFAVLSPLAAKSQKQPLTSETLCTLAA